MYQIKLTKSILLTNGYGKHTIIIRDYNKSMVNFNAHTMSEFNSIKYNAQIILRNARAFCNKFTSHDLASFNVYHCPCNVRGMFKDILLKDTRKDLFNTIIVNPMPNENNVSDNPNGVRYFPGSFKLNKKAKTIDPFWGIDSDFSTWDDIGYDIINFDISNDVEPMLRPEVRHTNLISVKDCNGPAFVYACAIAQIAEIAYAAVARSLDLQWSKAGLVGRNKQLGGIFTRDYNASMKADRHTSGMAIIANGLAHSLVITILIELGFIPSADSEIKNF